MIKKINVFVLIIYLLAGSSSFAQTTAQYKSKEIYDFSRIISEAAKDRIWTGFEPLRYLSLKTEAGKNYISFTSEPDNPNGQIFWTLLDEYFLTHSLEENLVITFHEAFHAFET